MTTNTTLVVGSLWALTSPNQLLSTINLKTLPANPSLSDIWNSGRERYAVLDARCFILIAFDDKFALFAAGDEIFCWTLAISLETSLKRVDGC